MPADRPVNGPADALRRRGRSGGPGSAPDPTTPEIIVDATWGYRRLAQVPGAVTADTFYESHYCDAISLAGRAPDLARLVVGGPDAERERRWLRATLYADILDALPDDSRRRGPRRSLDVGCGTGDLVAFLADAGWDAFGTEPSTEIAAVGLERGLRIEPVTGARFVDAWRASSLAPYNAITLINVLEHVPEPAHLILTLKETLAADGRLIARVPNDFSALQEAARDALGLDPWWIAVPDHVNYFDAQSISALFEQLGFEVVERMSDFPMELFLLMGDNYVGDPLVGAAVHERRRRLELGLPPGLRRSLRRSWAEAGIGRNVMVVARLPPGPPDGRSR